MRYGRAMPRRLILPLVLLLSAPLMAQDGSDPAVRLAPEHRVALRCGAAFALVASDQQRAAPGADRWPPLAERGREYFVRTAARIMDEAALGRDAVRDLVVREVAALQAESAAAADPAAAFGAVMDQCLPLLDAALAPVPPATP